MQQTSFVNSLSPLALSELAENGFVIGAADEVGDLLTLSDQLGNPVAMRKGGNLIDELRPLEEGDAKANSLSSRHGVATFPLHTDCAFWMKPARYIAFRAATDSEEFPTTLADTSHVRDGQLSRHLRNALFKVRNGKRSFLANVWNGSIFRMDRDCMVPANHDAIELLDQIERELQGAEIQVRWSAGMCLIVDNWRMLHGRSDCSAIKTADRLLHRVLIAEGSRC